jgi:hypothetical protein
MTGGGAMFHLARIALALGLDGPNRKVVVVLVCKLDASGTDRTNKTVTMAGYVGLLPAWSEFEIRARAICDREHVSILHAKEFYDTKSDFSGWSRHRKEAFVRAIRDASLGKLDLGITFSVIKTEFVKAKQEHQLAQSESPFGFCFRSIIDRLFSDPIISEVLERGENLTFILESGDENAGDAQRIFNQIKAMNPRFDRRLYSFGFADKRSSIGLQWADLLAVTSRRYIDKYDDQSGYPKEPTIISILRDRIYLIDEVATSFYPIEKTGQRC